MIDSKELICFKSIYVSFAFTGVRSRNLPPERHGLEMGKNHQPRRKALVEARHFFPDFWVRCLSPLFIAGRAGFSLMNYFNQTRQRVAFCGEMRFCNGRNGQRHVLHNFPEVNHLKKMELFPRLPNTFQIPSHQKHTIQTPNLRKKS